MERVNNYREPRCLSVGKAWSSVVRQRTRRKIRFRVSENLIGPTTDKNGLMENEVRSSVRRKPLLDCLRENPKYFEILGVS